MSTTDISVEWSATNPDVIAVHHYSPAAGWCVYHLIFQAGLLDTDRKRIWRLREIKAAYERGRAQSLIRWANQQDRKVRVERVEQRISA